LLGVRAGEYEGTSTSRGFGASEEPDAEAGRRSEDVGAELPADQATLAAISTTGRQGAEAPQCGERFEPREAREIPTKGAGAHRGEYSGTEQERFGPTLAAEHLADDDGLEVSEETLRRWMLAEGLWSRMRRRKAHRKRRERREHFGDLVQLDGSFHAWSEERGPRGYLINMVDDVKTPSPAKLREVFRLETERWISNDWVVQYRGHFLQLKPQNKRYRPTHKLWPWSVSGKTER